LKWRNCFLKFSGSYKKDDVEFLVKVIDIDFVSVREKEKLIQQKQKHYSEMLSPEYEPSEEYLKLFFQLFNLNKERFAKDILNLAYNLSLKKEIVLISLLRAGTPIGVLLKRTLKEKFNLNVPHFSISIIRDREIDENALNYILERYPNREFIFIDGWTGKGVINRELKKFIKQFNQKYNKNLSDKLYVISDIAFVSDYAVTNDDYLIPSSALNSTISGLVSRSILNEKIGKNEFHGCYYYKEFEKSDLSLWFIDEVMKIVNKLKVDKKELIKKSSDKEININNFLQKIQKEYEIEDINFIKPGIGETTRVLLRRVPYLIFLKEIKSPYVQHIVQLAKEKNVPIVEDKNLPYTALAIIKKVV